MSSLTEIKKGLIIKYNNAPCQVVEAKFLRMQQRKPVMQVKMRNIKTGQVVEGSIKPGEKIEVADVVRKRANFLYKEGSKYYFMDQEEYEQYPLAKEMLSDEAKFLKESQGVDLIFYEDSIIGLELPPKVDLKVVSAPEGVKGDSAGSVTKTATIETGYELNVPMFIKEGDVIRVNTETGEYVERVS